MANEMMQRVGAAILLAETQWTPKSAVSKEEAMAQAAFEAMREPSDAVLEKAGIMNDDSGAPYCTDWYFFRLQLDLLINAALKD